MILFHGSNVEVAAPRLFHNDRLADFGQGFYLTSSYEQASRWAQLVTRRRKQGISTVTLFEWDERTIDSLDVLRFDDASVEWLAFVGRNRRGEAVGPHDIVIGPVANDNTMPTLRLYFAGVLTEEESIKRLLPQKLHDQYAFKTERALSSLKFQEARRA